MAPLLVNLEDLGEIEVNFESTEIKFKPADWPLPSRYHHFHGYPKVVQKLWQHTCAHIDASFIEEKQSVGLKHINFGHAVLIGPVGGGKTHALMNLSYRLQKEKQCKVFWVDCIKWVDSK